MTRDDVIRLAREAAYASNWKPGLGNDSVLEFMERFAALVAADEREACAAICDSLNARYFQYPGDCAAAIRARTN